MAEGGSKLSWKELFPSKQSLVIFIAYMTLFINQGILVTATKTADNKYTYSTITVVMLTECLKLFSSIIFYCRDNAISHLFYDIVKNARVLLLYFVPAFLYCLYNNLAFINLTVFDPTTYYLLLQFRVVVTGIIFQILFKKKLSKKQWISLLLLTFGCVIKQLHILPSSSNSTSSPNTIQTSHIGFSLFLILLQIFCSCFAGVYNEFLLKGVGAEVHIMVQNVFMYVDSIVCNFVALGLNGEIATAFTKESVKSVFRPLIVCVMINNAGCGIVTSLFLKNLNSILKTFASALELVFTAILCWIIFGITIDIFTVISISIVSYSTYLYAQNPVVNKSHKTHESQDCAKLQKNIQPV
ncbi:UDP-galactose transporter senju [Centruroides vittatus]|uniref:UDP-galactose transporter senju n=1 Tax=Centruroides vittatus TaxID=120091 RepID=UPI0035104294